MRHWAFVFAITMVVVTLTGFTRAGDREVAEQIASKLQTSGQLRGYDVRVKFEDGTACLRGRVATHEQMTAALALAQRTKGVEKVINGLTVWAEPRRETRTAPVAPRQSVDYAVAQARLVPRSPPLAPAPRVQPDARVSLSTAEPPPELEPIDRQIVSDGTTFAIRVPEEALAFPEPEPSTGRVPAEPVRSLEFATSVEVLPMTAQKASFWASTGQVQVFDLHLATALTDFAEPMKLADESGSSAAEVLVSDEPERLSAVGPGNGMNDTIPLAESTVQPQLIQALPRPSRRPWTPGLHEYGLPTMQTTVGIPR